MNIKQVTGTLNTSFNYIFEVDGVEKTETISLTLKRISFGKAMGKDFQEASKLIDSDPTKIASLLTQVLESWDLTVDDNGTPYELTEENILACPPDFVIQMSDAITEKLFPNAQSRKPQVQESQNGSLPTENSTTAAMT
jgi:hypothetical protein